MYEAWLVGDDTSRMSGGVQIVLEELAELKGHEEPRVWHVAWTPSGLSLASCGEDKSCDRSAVTGVL